MSKKIRISVDEPPDFESTSIFCSLERETEEALRNLPNVYQHSVASLRFRQQISHPHLVSDEHREIMKVAYLRAALMEFVGMEEVLSFDLEKREKNELPLKIVDTECAMLTLLRELRHLQLHVVTSSFVREHRDAVYLEKPVVQEIDLVPYKDLQGIKNLRNSGRFDDDELNAAIEWLHQAQSVWGIKDVLQRGVQKYADILIDEYHL